MPRLQLESSTDIFGLDDVLEGGRGVQALSGANGLGLPPVAAQWLEGAGDGSIYRGRRILSRTIDLPLLIQGRNREDLKSLLSRFARLVSGPCTLRLFEDDGSSWTTQVIRTGGGDYTYGVDSIGENDFFTVVTFRAGDPYFTSAETYTSSVATPVTTGGLLGVGGLTTLSVAASSANGTIDLENIGDADAYPVWKVYGPGSDFKAVSPKGETLRWQGTLNTGEVLAINTKTGTVRDQNGTNRYSLLATAPRFWTIPPGISSAEASLQGTTPGVSKVVCTWQARRWMVI